MTTTYTVNALDQRMAKSNAGTSRRYVYGGFSRPLAEYTNGQWTSCLWSGNEPVALVCNNQIYYLPTDHLGRPQLATNASRTVVRKANYAAFNRGINIDSIGGARLGRRSNRFNFGNPGQYLDAESDLWHNDYRDYDWTTGRHLQSDPIGLDGSINTCAYIGGIRRCGWHSGCSNDGAGGTALGPFLGEVVSPSNAPRIFSKLMKTSAFAVVGAAAGAAYKKLADATRDSDCQCNQGK